MEESVWVALSEGIFNKLRGGGVDVARGFTGRFSQKSLFSNSRGCARPKARGKSTENWRSCDLQQKQTRDNRTEATGGANT